MRKEGAGIFLAQEVFLAQDDASSNEDPFPIKANPS
jgi:hypothetical protein